MNELDFIYFSVAKWGSALSSSGNSSVVFAFPAIFTEVFAGFSKSWSFFQTDKMNFYVFLNGTKLSGPLYISNHMRLI